MSSEPQLDSGGGGSDSTTSSTSDGSSGSASVSDGTLRIILPDWLLALRPLTAIVDDLVSIVTRPQVFIVVSLTGLSVETVTRLLLQKSAIAIIIDDYLFDTILLPLAIGIFTSGLNAINEFILITFGTDRQVGVAEGARPGLIDFPILLGTRTAFGFFTTGLTIFNVVALFNESIAGDLSSSIGLAAPFWVNFIWVVEMTVIGYTIWVLISFIPFFNVRGILLASTSIPRRILKRLL